MTWALLDHQYEFTVGIIGRMLKGRCLLVVRVIARCCHQT